MKTKNLKDKSKKKVGKIILYVAASLVLVITLANWFWTNSGSNKWKLEVEKNGVKIYSLKSPGCYKKQFKAIMPMDYYSLSQLVAGQIENSNMATCKELIPGCMDFQVIEPWSSKAKSDTMMWKIQLPGPFSPRENIIKSQVAQDKKTKAVTIDIMAAPNKTPRSDGSVRTTHNHCRWIFTPLKNGQVEIEYFQDISLGGFFPDLLINLTAVDTMYLWIHDQFPSLVGREKFKKVKYNFIEEAKKIK